jgi:hypothetical protein
MNTNVKGSIEWGVTILVSILIGWFIGWFWGGLSFASSMAIALLMKGFESNTSRTPLPGSLLLIAACLFSYVGDHIAATSLDGGAKVWQTVNTQELRHCEDYAGLGDLLSEKDKKLSQDCIDRRRESIDGAKQFKNELSEYTSFWGGSTNAGLVTFYLFLFARGALCIVLVPMEE